MAEQINLTTPVQPPALTYYQVREIRMNRDDGSSIYVRLRGTNGESFDRLYEGAAALALINQLNTANLSTQSLERRILLRLIADGVVSGTISGAPDA
jgi:hypothetical protein